jgi:non-specific serine/threonine protein kinase
LGCRLDSPHPAWPTILGNLGVALLGGKEHRRGIALLEEALALSRSTGQPLYAGLVLARLAAIDQAAGEQARAAARYGESLRLILEAGRSVQYDRAFVGLAGLAARGGHAEAAARLLGMVQAIQEGTGATVVLWPEIYDQAELAARTALGVDEFAAAVAAGRRLPPTDAVTEALAVAEALARGDQPSVPVSDHPATAVETSAATFGLSRRERQVLDLMAKRYRDKEIAETLFISYRTVETHAKHIFNKLGVVDRREAAAVAARHGLV